MIETHLMILCIILDPALKKSLERGVIVTMCVYEIQNYLDSPVRGQKKGAQSNSLMVCPDYRTVPKSLRVRANPPIFERMPAVLQRFSQSLESQPQAQ